MCYCLNIVSWFGILQYYFVAFWNLLCMWIDRVGIYVLSIIGIIRAIPILFSILIIVGINFLIYPQHYVGNLYPKFSCEMSHELDMQFIIHIINCVILLLFFCTRDDQVFILHVFNTYYTVYKIIWHVNY